MSASVAIFVGAVIVALISFRGFVQWARTQSQERQARERYALLRQLADQPSESVRIVLDRLRQDDALTEARLREKRREARREHLRAGVILVATGAGLALMLASLTAEVDLWTVGLIPGFIGLAIVGFELASGSRWSADEATPGASANRS